MTKQEVMSIEQKKSLFQELKSTEEYSRQAMLDIYIEKGQFYWNLYNDVGVLNFIDSLDWIGDCTPVRVVKVFMLLAQFPDVCRDWLRKQDVFSIDHLAEKLEQFHSTRSHKPQDLMHWNEQFEQRIVFNPLEQCYSISFKLTTEEMEYYNNTDIESNALSLLSEAIVDIKERPHVLDKSRMNNN